MLIDAGHLPVARADRLSTPADSLLTVHYEELLRNDRGRRLAVVDLAATRATHGSVRMIGGHGIYVPTPGFTGEARFRYTIRDRGGRTDAGWVRVTVGASQAIDVGDMP
ncbi:Ig-like domain-containing protein [Nocardioides sp. SR21]|uniref:Ig-like domain-containing protein n=1 Tax=Nocardioides sp. SR21 TaxID=2919501 RepID=UPI001FAAF874|nr:Ig-like domain-containing protein [Nocardioides sp. SR21]